MGTTSIYQKSGSNDPRWDCLAEYALSGITPGEEAGDALTAGPLFQPVQDLGIPSESLTRIEKALIEFVKQKSNHFEQDKIPIVIRLFYGKKTIKFGSWGFFIIDRSRELSTSSTADSPNFIDLFLYQEGE